MSSSKVWRKGRWFWSCTEDNGASDWKDSWSCGAVSRLTYSTKEDAEKASKAHGRKRGHTIRVSRVIGKKN